MKIGDVGGVVSASARAVFACAELWHGLETGNSAKAINGLTIVGRTSIGTWLQASDWC